MKQKLDYALAYARLGIPVLPLHYILEDGRCSCQLNDRPDEKCLEPDSNNRGKHPYKEGVYSATTHEGRIRACWMNNPDCNIGLACGVVFDVIDYDSYKDGGANQHLFDDTEWALTQKTGSGGMHYFVKPGFALKGIQGCVDIKAKGGYIAAEPSINTRGAYAFNDWDVLSEGLPELPEPPECFLKPVNNTPHEDTDSGDPGKGFDDLKDHTKRLIQGDDWDDHLKGDGTPDCSQIIWAVVKDCIRAGLTDAAILGIFERPDCAINTIRTGQKKTAAYIMGRIKAARPEIAQERAGGVDFDELLNGKTSFNVVPISELLSHKFPEREPVLSPVFLLASVNMIFSSRGIGKTFAGLGMAVAASMGGRFWGWQASRPFKTLYIDGEMPGESLQNRLKAITGNVGLPSDDFFRIATIDMNGGRMPDFSTVEGQNVIEDACQWAEVIMVDNLSCLARTGKANDEESWLTIGGWALRMRSLGKCVNFFHHAGKNGDQRGTSKKEDILDVVIELRKPGDYDPEQGARFVVRFTKARHLQGEQSKPFEAQLKDGAWEITPVEESIHKQIIELSALGGLSLSDIATELGVNKSTVSRHLNDKCQCKNKVDASEFYEKVAKKSNGLKGKKSQKHRADVDG